MDQYEEMITLLLEALKISDSETSGKARENTVTVGISNRHVHLSQADLNALFGCGYELTKINDLSQPGQFACKETVTVCGPKGAIEKVRILGPVRGRTQVEILSGDCFRLGVKAEPRMSGDLDKTPGITLVGPKGSVQTKEGLMVAQRHIHMLPNDAVRFGVHDGQSVSIKTQGIRGGVFDHVIIRVTPSSALECHVDTEEANAMGLDSSSIVTIVNGDGC